MVAQDIPYVSESFRGTLTTFTACSAAVRLKKPFSAFSAAPAAAALARPQDTGIRCSIDGGDLRRDQPLLTAAIAEQFRPGNPGDPPARASAPRVRSGNCALRLELIGTRNQAGSALERDSHSPASVADGSDL